MNKALLIVDVQNDFCPGGSYPVPNGDKIIQPLNTAIEYAERNNWLIIASRDWHPPATKNIKGWTPHCIQNTKGAEFHPDLILPSDTIVISKGEDIGNSHYSAFNGDDIDLHKTLQENNVSKLHIGGLALDYCVKNTALDAIDKGYEVTVLKDATKAVNKNPADEKNTLNLLQQKGVGIATVNSLITQNK